MIHKLVTIGINKYNEAPLRGCLNDSKNVRDYWQRRFAIPDGNVLQILDEQATARALEDSFDWLLKGAMPYESSLTWHCSSHGTQVRDISGDEHDRLDEAIVPYDWSWDDSSTWFTDDRISRLLEDVPAGVNVTLLVDACHAGTLVRSFRNPKRYRSLPMSPTRRRKTNLPARRGWRSWLGMQPPLGTVGGRLRDRAVLVCATDARQLAADDLICGEDQGANTFSLLHVLQQYDLHGTWPTYAELVARMRRWIRVNGYDNQRPQLQGLRSARRLLAFMPFPNL